MRRRRGKGNDEFTQCRRQRPPGPRFGTGGNAYNVAPDAPACLRSHPRTEAPDPMTATLNTPPLLDARGLRFTRNDVADTAVHTNGDATGLKNLAGKQDCLTVKPGEGYCRD